MPTSGYLTHNTHTRRKREYALKHSSKRLPSVLTVVLSARLLFQVHPKDDALDR